MLSMYWSMAAIPASLLLQASKTFLGLPSRSPNAASFIRLPLFPNVGSSNVPSHGLKNAVDSGKTASVNSTQACKWLLSLSSSCCSKDHKQALSPRLTLKGLDHSLPPRE